MIDRRQTVWKVVGALACVSLGVLTGSLYATASLIIWAALVAIQGMMIVCLAAVVAYDTRNYIKELDKLRREQQPPPLAAQGSHDMNLRMAQIERDLLFPDNRLH